MAKNGCSGTMGATLTRVSYNSSPSFNLLSLLSLLSLLVRDSWHITSCDATGIAIENGSKGKLVLDIVMPMESGTIYTIQFVWDNDVNVASMEAGPMLSNIKVHGLLGYGYDDGVHQVVGHFN